jgi:hypothetical protein
MTDIHIWCGIPAPKYQMIPVVGMQATPVTFAPDFKCANDDTPPDNVSPTGGKVNRMRIVK